MFKRLRANWIVFLGCFFGAIQAMGQTPSGIVCGVNVAGVTYAALVLPDGTLIPVSGLPTTSGDLLSADLNASGMGIIGGQIGNPGAYAALVSPNGTLTALSGANLPTATGVIQTVAINNSGTGIIAGGQGSSTATPGYAALVAPNGTLTQLGVGNQGGFPYTTGGYIYAGAINDSGVALLGGALGSNPAYAAVYENGALTQLGGGGQGGFPSTHGAIFTVAINNNGMGVIGGQDLTGAQPAYAAFATLTGTPTLSQISGLPSTGVVNSVAINASGAAIVGGQNGILSTGSAYAALVTSTGTLTVLSGLPANGAIDSVAINSSGTAIIGGGSYSPSPTGYAALVSPTGTHLTPLSGANFPTVEGAITSVAINNEGVGLIGGYNGSILSPVTATPYAALVAPNGTLTQLSINLPSGGVILSVALAGNFSTILEAVTPTSVGAFNSSISSLLSATSVFVAHEIDQKLRISGNGNQQLSLAAQLDSKEESNLVAQAGNRMIRQPLACKEPPFTFWFSPFYDQSKQLKQGIIPTYTNQTGGAITGIDYWPTNQVVLGGGVAYAFNYVQVSESIGHSKVNQEMALYYTSYQGDYVFVNASFWGGFYQLKNKRYTLGFIPATSNTHGWLFSPHFELSAANYKNFDWVLTEPFVQLDWVNNWQKGYTEKGASGLNLIIKSQHNSLLRSEAGLRFYEVFSYCWGRFVLEEKGSYINKAPFGFGPTTTSFIGSASTFSVETGSNRVENLGGVEVNASFIPANPRYPYGQLGFQGEFGPSFQSYFVNFEIGKMF